MDLNLISWSRHEKLSPSKLHSTSRETSAHVLETRAGEHVVRLSETDVKNSITGFVRVVQADATLDEAGGDMHFESRLESGGPDDSTKDKLIVIAQRLAARDVPSSQECFAGSAIDSYLSGNSSCD